MFNDCFILFQAIKGDGCRRRIKHILEYLLGIKDFQDMFAGQDEPTIHLRFAGDGRQTSKKIGTVMAVFSVLEEGVHTPDHQYTTCLYNGKFSHCFSFNRSGEFDSLWHCIVIFTKFLIIFF